MKRRTSAARNPEMPPAWYWSRGLHDACITGVETVEFPADMGTYTCGQAFPPVRVLKLSIQASGALFDCSVTEIRLFNYKILTPEICLENRKQIWWVSDRLTVENGRYQLELELQDFDASPKQFLFRVRFTHAEVLRA